MDVINNLQTEQVLQGNHRRRIWLRVVSALAAITVFCTVYALVLPAITEEAETFCGYEEHTHGTECYGTAQLICGEEECEAHTHTEACLAEESVLSCGLAETEGHTHTDACYAERQVLCCGLTENDGSEMRTALVCGQTECEAHSHTEACYVTEQVLSCTLTEDENHTHSDACYTATERLACGREETAGHTHTETCYAEQPVAEAHTHTESCYTTEQVLTCGQEEFGAHTHTEDCYTTEQNYACGKEEADGHTHSDACYAPAEGEPELICELEEHSHTLQCYSDPEADVESAGVWSRSVASVQLTGEWRKDLVAIAGTQLGYTESSRNYRVEGDVVRGYSRYGAWYGNAYGDWCAMFVSFCLNYADIPAADFPREAGTRPWVEKLTAANMYVPAEGYVPTVGDLVFFDYDEDELSDHVGIVSAVKTAEDGSFTGIATIEGNAGDRVASLNYAAGDKTLLGYGILPENPALATEEETEDAAQELELITKTATAGDYLVTASYTSEAGLPEEAVFEAYVIDPESEAFAARAVEYYEATGKTMEFLLNIGFYVDGVEVEPTGTVNITICFLGEEDYAGVDPAIVHFGESVTETLENTPVDENAETAFAMDSFTEIGGTLSDGSDAPATTATVVASGKIYQTSSNYITWTLTDDGVLTISGNARIPDYSSAGSAPWYSYRNQITSLVVEDGVTQVGSYAFAFYSKLKNVTLGKDVAAINRNAFQSCSALTAVHIPSAVKSIGEYAFNACTAVSSLTIENGVTNIGNCAFYGCNGLAGTELHIPDSVSTIGYNALQYCRFSAIYLGSGLTKLASQAVYNGNDAPVYYNGTATQWVQVAKGGSTIFGTSTEAHPVYVLDEDGSYVPFDGNDVDMTGWTEIPDYAFYGCTELTKITIPNTVTRIGNNAFSGCTGLTEVEVPDSVTSLGNYVFSGCTGLESASLGDGVTKMGVNVFQGCTALTSATISAGITALPNSTFYRCTALTAVELPESLTEIGQYAFNECTALSEIELPEGLTKIDQNAFNGCTSLTAIALPEGFTTIDGSAFKGCTKLATVVIPASLRTSGQDAFRNAYVKEVHISSLEAWLQVDFTNYYSNPLNYYLSNLYLNGELVTDLVIPEGTTEIKNYTFYYDAALTSVTFPESLTKIGNGAFYNCDKITEIIVPSGVTEIGNTAFENCKAVTKVSLPENLKVLGYQAFYALTELRELTLPEGLETIGNFGIAYCSRLKALVVPDSVTSIGNSAFYNNKEMAQLTLGTGISTIPSGVVDTNGVQTLTLRCAELSSVSASTAGTGKTVILDDTVNSVAAAAWTGLEKAGYRNVIFNGPNVLSLPAMKLENGGQIGGGTYYATEEGVLYLLDTVAGTASLAYVPDGLTEYTVPEAITAEGEEYTVTGVESYALSGADDLTALSIEAPEELLAVGQEAFAGAEQLASINGCTTPDAVRELFTNENAVIGSNLTDGTKIGGAETTLTEENRQTNTVTVEYNYSGDDQIRVNLAQRSDSTANRKGITEDGVFEYYTGYGDSLGITISNSANMTEEAGTVIRTYISFDAPEGNLSLTEGAHTVTSADKSTVIPYTVVKVNDYLYYIEVKAEDTNHSTSEITFSLTYPNGSAGGNARVWTVIGDAEELTENPANGATGYQQIRWLTEKIPYYIDKALSTTKLSFNSEADGSITAKDFTYTITPKTESTKGTSYGMDVVTTISYTDVFTLSDGLVWNPEYLEAIKDGRWYATTGTVNTYREIYVIQADGTEVMLFRLKDQEMAGLIRKGPQLEVVTGEDGKETVQITWEDLNSYAYSQDAAKRIQTTKGRTYTLDVYKGAVLLEDEPSEALLRKTYTVTNSVDTEWQYRYSGPVNSGDEETAKLWLSNYSLVMSKTVSGGSYYGSDRGYQIAINNTGNLPYPNGDTLTDVLQRNQYISPANMYLMLTDENWGSSLQITINTAYFETAAFTPRQVTLTDGTSAAMLTEPQNSGYNTAYGTGNATDWSTAGDGTLYVSEDTAYYTTGKLQLWWQEGTLYLQKDEEPAVAVTDAADLQAQLNAMGFFVGPSTTYGLVWTPRVKEGDTTFVIPGGTIYKFNIYATLKDTFMQLSQDHLHEHSISTTQSVSNSAYLRSTTGSQTSASTGTGTIYKEFYITKAVTDAQGESTKNVTNGDVIRYSVNVTNKGSHVYDMLPWTDRMVGAQLLLAPADGNEALAGTSAEPYTGADGTQYYKLKPADGVTEVTFRNVLVAGKVADTVMVARTASGYVTLIKWYFSGAMPKSTTLSYEVLVDSTVAGDFDEKTGFSLGNVTWLGDHQGHRIFAPVSVRGHNMYHDKNIVTGTDDNGEDVLEKHSIVYEGDTVTYRLEIRNMGGDVYTVNSSSVYDVLPLSLQGADWSYLWSRENVTIRYGGSYENAEQSVISGGDSWHITEGEAAGSNGALQQELRWGEDFLVQIPGGDSTFYIYVTLQYPANSGTADYWSRYCEMNAGNDIQNSFHIADMVDTVSHELGEAPEVLLQKGVVSTSLVSENPDAEDAATALHQYENGGAYLGLSRGADTQKPVKPVTYYTAIYNDGNARLYLETIEDILPEGFICKSNGGGDSSGPAGGVSLNSSGNIVDIASASGKEVKYLTSKQVTAVNATFNSNNSTRVHLFFNLKLDADHYSEENEHYYLLPGEAIVITYTVYVSPAVKTADIATNRVAMSYFNYYNVPIQVSDATITGTGTGSAGSNAQGTYAPNDGGCEVLTSEQIAAQGYSTTSTNPQWLESQVSLTRKKIIPGIVKTAYSATSELGVTTMYPRVIHSGDTVTWHVRLLNDGEAAISGYTFTDTIPAGNQFTGQIKLREQTGYASYSEKTLFEITGWSEDGTKATIRYVYNGSQWGSATLSEGREQYASVRGQGSTYVGYISYYLKYVRNDDGSTTISIRTENGCIDAGYEAVFLISTKQTGDVRYGEIENTASFSPLQSYDPLDVVHDDGADDRDDTVTWSDNVWLLSDHMTYPEIQVTETADRTNYGIGSSAENHIILPERNSSFYYTLTVNNSTNYSMEKLILINNLPEVGDGDTYNAESKRDSAFKVVLDPERTGFTVKVKDGDGNVTVLDPSVYTIEFSTLTSFPATAEDWTGGNAQNWTAQSDWAAYAATNGLTYDDIRSIRVIITDPDAANLTVIPENSVITVDFYALVDDPYGMAEDGSYLVKDGTIAWDTFGYRYRLDGQELFAGSRKVGVEIPSIPIVIKNIQAPTGDPVVLREEQSFKILIYSGSAIDSLAFDWNDLETTLAGRSFTVATLTVPAGESSSGAFRLDASKAWKANGAKLSPTNDAFTWQTDGIYTAVEVRETQYEGVYESLWEGGDDDLSFRNANGVTITCINRLIGYTLPGTGGNGTHWYTLGGALLTGTAAAALFGTWRRRRKEESN